MTNGEHLQSISMERLAEELEGMAACCPEGRECSARSEDELGQDDCEMCWKAWLLTEREGETDD